MYEQLFHLLRADIQINLLGRIVFAEGRPHLKLFPCVLNGESGVRLTAAQEHFIDVRLYRLSIRPDFIQRKEQIGVAGLPPVLQKVLKVRGLAGDMIDHQVHQHIMPLPDCPDVRPIPKGRLDLQIGQRCKTAVPRRREWRQNMHPALEHIRKIHIQRMMKRLQISAKRVRVRNQLHLIFNHHLLPLASIFGLYCT
ncbi:hypothetical protein D3C73_610740 [compost metagenome]